MSSSFTAFVQSSIASSSFLSFRRERAVILHGVVTEGARRCQHGFQTPRGSSHAGSLTVPGHWESQHLSEVRILNLKLVSFLSDGSQAHLSIRINHLCRSRLVLMLRVAPTLQSSRGQLEGSELLEFLTPRTPQGQGAYSCFLRYAGLQGHLGYFLLN